MRVGTMPRTGRSRQLAWALSLGAVLLVPLTLLHWQSARQQATSLAGSHQRHAALAPVVKAAESRLSAWGLAVAELAPTRERLQNLGEMPGSWQSQTITLEHQPMSRREAERYLHDLSSGDQRWLVPSAIHLRAASASESLFGVQQALDAPGALLVTVKAELFTRKVP